MGTQYYFNEIIRDSDGEIIVGDIVFTYNGRERCHEFTFSVEKNKLVSIDYGYFIPDIEELWPGIEGFLINYNQKGAKNNGNN